MKTKEEFLANETQLTKYCDACKKHHPVKAFRLRKQTLSTGPRWYRLNICWEAEKKNKKTWNRNYVIRYRTGKIPVPKSKRLEKNDRQTSKENNL